MSVSATVRAELTVTETLAVNVQGSTSPQIVHDAFNATLILDGLGTGGTAVITQGKAFVFTLAAGVFTIDLTSLPASGGGTFSATGLRLIAALFVNPTTNNAAINIAPGASNPYNFTGTANDFSVLLGGFALFYTQNQGIDIDATHKTLDLAGSGTDVLNCVMTFG